MAKTLLLVYQFQNDARMVTYARTISSSMAVPYRTTHCNHLTRHPNYHLVSSIASCQLPENAHDLPSKISCHTAFRQNPWIKHPHAIQFYPLEGLLVTAEESIQVLVMPNHKYCCTSPIAIKAPFVSLHVYCGYFETIWRLNSIKCHTIRS